MAIPTLTAEQLASARAAATEARRARAVLKTRLRTGEITLGEAIDIASADTTLCHVRVMDLVKALPRVGDKRAAEILERHDIAANRRVRGLGRHQVAALKQAFG